MSQQFDMTKQFETQAIAALTAKALKLKEVAGIPFLVLDGAQDTKSLERFLPKPQRRSGCTYVQDQAGFITIFDRYKNDDSTMVYADRKKGWFKAVFNDHSPQDTGWRDHVCAYACEKSNEWNAWLNKDGVKMTQEEFAQFIEQNLVDIVDPSRAHMLEISRELVARKSANFSSSIRLSNGSHQFSYDEDIKGSIKSGKLKVPETFKIGIPVFLNDPCYGINARLRCRIKDKSLQMWYELIRPHGVYEDAFNEIHASITEATGMELVSADY